MQPRFVDLHTHTTASDGSDTPTELIQKAAERGLAAVAVTDHDTVSGLDEAVETGNRLGVEVIRGCELSVHTTHGEVHLLGLWLPEGDSELDNRLKALRKGRDERNDLILERLRALGIPLELEQVLAESRGESVGRPHIARALLRYGYVSSLQDAFYRYLGKNGAAYEPREELSPAAGVQMLTSLGATVSMAHPMLVRCPPDWLNNTVAELAALGMTAIEAYHSEHSARDERVCAELATRHGLGITGGSDYHGSAKPRIVLGRGKGGLRVTEAVFERLKDRRRAAGLPV